MTEFIDIVRFMRTSRPDPAVESAVEPAAEPAAATTARRSDRTQRLLGVAAAALLIGGLATVGATGLNWWSRIHRIEANQVKLARTVDVEWPRSPEHHQAGRAGNAMSVPVAQGTAAQGTAAQDTSAPSATPLPSGSALPSGSVSPSGSALPSGPASSSSGAVARLHIPRLRLDLVVVEGAGEADLLRGPGHISNTPLFGQPGNVGIAGHRYPGVFWDLDRLRDGDHVVVETHDEWYVYRVSREMIVGPSDVDVLAPRPAGAPEGARNFLTLVTCDPVFTTLHRLIRQAVLVRATPRADGAPPELAIN
ncbi:MAG: class sortase [Dactylosporangium sp.]|nr:class sortase [Dactylosporangium sp.]